MIKYFCILIIFCSINALANVTLEDVAEELFKSKNIRVTNILVNEVDNPLGKLIDPDGEGGHDDSEIFFNLNGKRKNCFMHTHRQRHEGGRIEYSVRIYDCGSMFQNLDPTEYKGKVFFEE